MFNTSTKQSLRKTAVDWFIRLQQMDVEDSDRTDFEAWVMASPSHQAAYAEVAGMWDKLDSTPQLERLNSALKKKKALAQAEKRRYAASAFSLLLMIGISIFGFQTWQAQPVMQMTAKANVGELINQKLDDGTNLVINTNSDVDIAYYRNKRVVNLNRGEAIFEVAKDSNRPFIVETDTAKITVLGTRFVVNKLRNIVRISVDHGSVKVEAKNGADNGAAIESTILTNGQVAEVILDQAPKKVNRSAADAFTFQQGIITFTNAELAEISETLSRYRQQPMQLAEGENINAHITAVVKSRNVERFIKNLPSLAPIKLMQQQNQLLITSATNN